MGRPAEMFYHRYEANADTAPHWREWLQALRHEAHAEDYLAAYYWHRFRPCVVCGRPVDGARTVPRDGSLAHEACGVAADKALAPADVHADGTPSDKAIEAGVPCGYLPPWYARAGSTAQGRPGALTWRQRAKWKGQ